jgi:hypothetical protein
MKEATDRQISQYTSKIGANGGKKRWSQHSADQRKVEMAKVRMAKIQKIAKALRAERPKASNFWVETEARFLADNALGRENKE